MHTRDCQLSMVAVHRHRWHSICTVQMAGNRGWLHCCVQGGVWGSGGANVCSAHPEGLSVATAPCSCQPQWGAASDLDGMTIQGRPHLFGELAEGCKVPATCTLAALGQAHQNKASAGWFSHHVAQGLSAGLMLQSLIVGDCLQLSSTVVAHVA